MTSIFLSANWPAADVTAFLVASGLLGFALGDLLLFQAFAHLGAARTLKVAPANAIRILAALLFLLALSGSSSGGFKKLSREDLGLVVFSFFVGTFLALFLYLYAISKENPAIIAALGVMAPLYSAIHEYWKKKRTPAWPFSLAMLWMVLGVLFSTSAP